MMLVTQSAFWLQDRCQYSMGVRPYFLSFHVGRDRKGGGTQDGR